MAYDLGKKLRDLVEGLPNPTDVEMKVVKEELQAEAPPTPSKKQQKRLFIIVSEDLSGLGWVKKLQEEGEQVLFATQMGKDEKDKKQFEQVGKGWLPRAELSDAIKKFGKDENVYWIFDSNHLSEESEKLRKAGAKVFGASKLMASLEHDRALAVKMAKDSGLSTPETQEFGTVEEGLKFLDENLDKAYVFKPDASEFNHLTFVPFREKAVDANRELYYYLRNVPFEGTYILQEKKYGVEVNVELWLSDSKPILATVTLENKHGHQHDLGDMVGCAGDVVFLVPLDGKLVQETVGKTLPFYKDKHYTGFIDVNVIIGDREIWFLEVCDRFGYSAHPNLFLNLALDGFGDTMADWIDGHVSNFEKRFRQGYGTSITTFADHKREGLPFHIDPEQSKHFYPFDGYKEGEDLLLTGYSGEVGIFCAFDYTISDSAKIALDKLFYREAVSFPGIWFRTDLGEFNYQNNPQKRHEALRRLGLIT